MLGRVDDVLMLGNALAHLAGRNQQQLVYAFECGHESWLGVVIGNAGFQAFACQWFQLLLGAANGDQITGIRPARQQRVDD
ncbi:hypothetical protein D3C74_206210 [compost metagenome]